MKAVAIDPHTHLVAHTHLYAHTHLVTFHTFSPQPDWDDLGEKYENSKKVVIGDVDCTVDANKELCEAQGVTGYPTIKAYAPGDKVGEVYEGERDLKALKAFVKTLGPQCSPQHPKRCTAEQRAKLDELTALSDAELDAKIEEAQKKITSATEEHDATVKSLQEKYEQSQAALDAIKKETQPVIKLMRAAKLRAEPKEATESKAEL